MYSVESNKNTIKNKNGAAENKFANNIKEWTRGHDFTSGISPKDKNIVGEQIRQLIELQLDNCEKVVHANIHVGIMSNIYRAHLGLYIAHL